MSETTFLCKIPASSFNRGQPKSLFQNKHPRKLFITFKIFKPIGLVPENLKQQTNIFVYGACCFFPRLWTISWQSTSKVVHVNFFLLRNWPQWLLKAPKIRHYFKRGWRELNVDQGTVWILSLISLYLEMKSFYDLGL